MSIGTTVTYQGGVFESQIAGLSDIEKYVIGDVFICATSYCNILQACDIAASNPSSTVGAIVGAVIGAVTVIVAIILVSRACCCRTHHSKNFHQAPSTEIIVQHPVFMQPSSVPVLLPGPPPLPQMPQPYIIPGPPPLPPQNAQSLWHVPQQQIPQYFAPQQFPSSPSTIVMNPASSPGTYFS